jgi:hypothetical protein
MPMAPERSSGMGAICGAADDPYRPVAIVPVGVREAYRRLRRRLCFTRGRRASLARAPA